jgi:glucose-1-phosphate adenylyltransferase
MPSRVLALVMAGGKGERLMPLTRYRSKPSVPFGGRYRIADFVLSNLVNSGIHQIYVLTQYKAQSLIEHLMRGWARHTGPGQFITPVPAQMRTGETWYRGTADAIYQNLHLIDQNRPDLVAIFGADHIYKMNIRQMVDFHRRRNAACTVACIPVPLPEAHSYGIVRVDANWRIVEFLEKPESAPEAAGLPGQALASMGNYVWSPRPLHEFVTADSVRESAHDFGRTILPEVVKHLPVYAYDFSRNRIPGADGDESGYWRDVGTLEAYYEANLDLKNVQPHLNLYNWQWPIMTAPFHDPPAKFVFDEEGRRGLAVQSIVGDGSIIAGGLVKDSVLGRNVFVDAGAQVYESILMDHVNVGPGAIIRRAIVDKNVHVPAGDWIGYDPTRERDRYHVSESGIVVVPKAEDSPETRGGTW